VRALDVARRVADEDGRVPRPATRSLQREPDQVVALVRLTAEGALPAREEAREAEALEPGLGDGLRIAGERA
jgi:hypothetical protein